MQKSIKIAIVEDNDFDYELIERKLKTIGISNQIMRAQDEKDFLDILNGFSPDLILSDFSLPSFSGFEALKIAKSVCPDIPFLFVSGTIGEELAVETLKQGAVDYVIKDNLNKLQPAIMRALNEAEEKKKRREAEEKLVTKNKELRALVYRISHDIRGPLCTIKGAINLIWGLKQEEGVSENYFEYVKLIEEVVRKLDGIVLNLGSFNYIYGDTIKAHKIKLTPFLDELKTAIAATSDFENIKFNLTVKQDKDFVGEPRLLFSVFYNLLHNAIVFSDQGKKERVINFTVDSSEKLMRAEIEDNGIGIEEDIKDNIFNMFYRGTQLSKGAGLGLYITKTILDQLHGSIIVDSEQQKGTKVSVNIPSMQLN